MSYRVAFKHYRIPVGWEYEPLHYRRKRSKWTPQPKGGKTECFLYFQGRLVARGETVCSLSDNYSYREGREWAFEYALLRTPPARLFTGPTIETEFVRHFGMQFGNMEKRRIVRGK